SAHTPSRSRAEPSLEKSWHWASSDSGRVLLNMHQHGLRCLSSPIKPRSDAPARDGNTRLCGGSISEAGAPIFVVVDGMEPKSTRQPTSVHLWATTLERGSDKSLQAACAGLIACLLDPIR